MLHFPMPDAELRERIWQNIFPKEAPSDNLDFSLLARQLELSGAAIKNCAVHAACIAAAQDREITMNDIVAGAKNEYIKHGKTLSPQIFQFM